MKYLDEIIMGICLGLPIFSICFYDAFNLVFAMSFMVTLSYISFKFKYKITFYLICVNYIIAFIFMLNNIFNDYYLIQSLIYSILLLIFSVEVRKRFGNVPN